MRTCSGLLLTEHWALDRFKMSERVKVLYIGSRACGMNERPNIYVGYELIIRIALPKMLLNRSIL